jgi:phosphohistidine phosphatase
VADSAFASTGIFRSMHQLLLLRHAKSSWDDATQPDRERGLNKRGRRAAAAMRAALREFGLAPDVVLVSPARRTQETLAALEPWDDMPLIDHVEALYLANVQELLAILHGASETVRSLMLIGHNPGLHELAVMLAGSRPQPGSGEMARRLAAGFPTGTLAEFAVAGPWWQLDAGGGQLVRFVTPRDLRDGEVADKDS